ncbi:MAG: glycine cleavage system protein GcvH [Candidatus Nanopelagicaceae bacterium]|jgi:glycine cleavage system H protein|nr:glycine cleavage system protein GcvH [Actinomycetota bacterium]
MSNIPQELRYTKEHEWISGAGPVVKVGITDFAQAALGDIVYIQLPKVGDTVKADAVCGEVESTKSVSEIYSPLSGKIVSVNESLNSQPEIINGDPYGSGWICEIEVADVSAINGLLTAEQYSEITA